MSSSFDITYLSTLPNFIVMAASDEAELVKMINTSVEINDKPCAFRYPRGNGTGVQLPDISEKIQIGKAKVVREGKKIAILNFGARLNETLKATEALAKKGFNVLPYIHADPVLCKRLEDVGTAAVMPLGAPIGSNKGLKTLEFLEIIIAQSSVPVIVDAGIGAPSHAAHAMEIGADAVLVNTAIAVAQNPIEMADAFRMAVIAGRKAYNAKLAPISNQAEGSSPLTSFLDA